VTAALVAACLAGPARDLGHPADHRRRDAATGFLARAWPVSDPALRAALHHPAAEVRRRAAQALRAGRAARLGDFAAFPPADWPAVWLLRADWGDDDGLPVTPDGADAVLPGRVAAFARRAGLVGPGERYAAEPGPGVWWDWRPAVTLHDLRLRFRGLDGWADPKARWKQVRATW
jgi:hypothetical protein